METVFDHDPTHEELLLLFGSERSIALARNPATQTSPDSNFSDIVRLMSLRKDKEAVQEYLAKISDPKERSATSYGLLKLA